MGDGVHKRWMNVQSKCRASQMGVRSVILGSLRMGMAGGVDGTGRCCMRVAISGLSIVRLAESTNCKASESDTHMLRSQEAFAIKSLNGRMGFEQLKPYK